MDDGSARTTVLAARRRRGGALLALGIAAAGVVWLLRAAPAWLRDDAAGSAAAPSDAPGAPDAAGAPGDVPRLAGAGRPPPTATRDSPTPAPLETAPPSTAVGSATGRRGATIVGRVVDARALPLAGVAVDLDRVRPIALALGVGPAGRWDVLRATTDADGRYRFEHVLGNDDYRVRLRTATAIERLEVAGVALAGTTVDLGTTTLDAGRRLVGRVVDGDGHGVAGARVVAGPVPDTPRNVVLDDPAKFPDPDGTTTTDADGAFVLDPVSRDAVAVLARAPSGASGTSDVPPAPTDPDAPVAPVTLVVGGAAFVAGVVVEAGDVAVPDAIVAVARPTGGGAVRTTTTGPDGRFRVDHVPAGPYVVAAFAGDRAPRLAPVLAPKADLRLEVPRGGRLVGRVVSAETGRPVERFRVTLEPLDREAGGDDPMQSTTAQVARERGPRDVVAPDGRFSLGPLLSAPYDVVVLADGCAPASPATIPDVPIDGVADVGEIVVHPARYVRGRVVDAVGSPVDGADVTALDAALAPSPLDFLRGSVQGPHEPTRTDGEGRFEIGPLVPGAYVVVAHRSDASRPPARSEPVSLVVRDADDVRVAFPREGGRLVVDARIRGRPIDKAAAVLLFHAEGYWQVVRARATDLCEIQALLEGRWLAAITGPQALVAFRQSVARDAPTDAATTWARLRAIPGTTEVRVDAGVDLRVRVDGPPLVRWRSAVRAEGATGSIDELFARRKETPEADADWVYVDDDAAPVDFGYREAGRYVVWAEIGGTRFATEVDVPDQDEFTTSLVLRR